MTTTRSAPTVAEYLAIQRCIDVHGVRWDQPTVLRAVMDPCEACKSWGKYVASGLPRPAAPAASDTVSRAGVRRVLRELLRRRDEWAHSTLDCAVARAIAYQSAAGLLHRLLDEEPPS